MKIGVILDNEITRDLRVLNEIKILKKCGHKIFVLCPDLYHLGLNDSINDIEIKRFPMTRRQRDIFFAIINSFPLYNWIWKKEIYKFILETDVEALHTHDLYMSKPVFAANKKFKLPITLDLHENFPAAIQSYRWATHFPKNIIVRPSRWSKLEKSYLEYADNIVVLCNTFKNELLCKYPNLQHKKIVVYPNVPDIDELLKFKINTDYLPRKKDDFILFYFGNIGFRRGLTTCFEALKKLHPVYPQIKLLLIGPIDKIDHSLFENYMKDPDITDSIIYHKWIDISDFPSFIHQADVGLSPLIKNPQHDSGIANKVFQYMLFEKPVLVSDCTPQQELVEETKCGSVFKNLNVNDLVEKIKFLYTHPKVCEQMGKNGKEAILKKYNLDSLGLKLNDLYQSDTYST